MRPLPLGLEYRHTFTVTDAKTVPALYPEAPEFLVMPRVFAVVGTLYYCVPTKVILGNYYCRLVIKASLIEPRIGEN